MSIILVLAYSLSSALNISLVVATSIQNEEMIKNIFQEIFVEKGFSVLERTDLSFVLDERKLISLKAFESEKLRELSAADILVIVRISLSDKGDYDIGLKAVYIQNGEIIMAKNYEAPWLYKSYVKEIAIDFSENLLKSLNYSDSVKRVIKIKLLKHERSGPYVLRITGIKNGWVKIFEVERGFLRFIYEFQILANGDYDFIIGEKNSKFKILWLPKYIPMKNIEFSKLEDQITKEEIEGWYTEDVEF